MTFVRLAAITDYKAILESHIMISGTGSVPSIRFELVLHAQGHIISDSEMQIHLDESKTYAKIRNRSNQNQNPALKTKNN